MNEIVERAARAAFAKFHEGEMGPSAVFETAPMDVVDKWLDAQRAAIEAMREPTLSQCQKAALVVFHDGPKLWRDGKYVEMAERMWPAMIDEALK